MQQFVSNLKTFLEHLARTFQIQTPLRYNVFILRLPFALVVLIVQGIDNVLFCLANSFETLESTCHVALLTTIRIIEQTGHCEKAGTMDTSKSGRTLHVSIHSSILEVKNRSMGIIN